MIIASKVHFFHYLLVLKVFKPDFCQTLDFPNLVFILTCPSTYPTTSLSSLMLVVCECGRIL